MDNSHTSGGKGDEKTRFKEPLGSVGVDCLLLIIMIVEVFSAVLDYPVCALWCVEVGNTVSGLEQLCGLSNDCSQQNRR